MCLEWAASAASGLRAAELLRVCSAAPAVWY